MYLINIHVQYFLVELTILVLACFLKLNRFVSPKIMGSGNFAI